MSSKQTARKNRGQNRPMTGSGQPTVPMNRPKTTSGQPTIPTGDGAASGQARMGGQGGQVSAQARARPQAQARQRAGVVRKKSGFRLRPLDIALVVAGLAVIALIVWSSIQTPSAQVGQTGRPAPIPIGQLAPDFALPATDGTIYSLGQFRGDKVVLLEFFAPWCPHCQDDAPMFNALNEIYKDKGVQFLAISAHDKGRNYQEGDETPISMGDVTWFRDTYSVQFPMLFDQTVSAGDTYGVMFFPTVYIVDKEGKVASMPTGDYTFNAQGDPESKRTTSLTQGELAAALDAVLAGGSSE